ncbi:hypothetical protein B0H16DRAFT_1803421 [Mycena metata]|uniref:Uncharacterized protein n=1 Tax=Mycena metata TaxID=1033252 RepID=A0AAD7KCX4_9AGAR|nr:hypothetical protein B0H16DRAFT_1803421 [Mycena metata]
MNNHQTDYIGPIADPRGGIYIHRPRPEVDSNICIHAHVVKVGTANDRRVLEFWRLVAFQPLDLNPTYFPTGDYADEYKPANLVNYIIPPMNWETAMQAVTYGPTLRRAHCTKVTLRHHQCTSAFYYPEIQREVFIDINHHRFDIFCSVFRKQDGTYDCVQTFSASGEQIVGATTLIFAPTAWKHGAKILANYGRTASETKYRLLCVLPTEVLVTVHIESIYVELPEGWRRQGEPL